MPAVSIDDEAVNYEDNTSTSAYTEDMNCGTDVVSGHKNHQSTFKRYNIQWVGNNSPLIEILFFTIQSCGE